MSDLPDRDEFVNTTGLPGDTRAECIRLSMFAIKRFMVTLNVSSKKCECCNRRAYENWDEFQTFQTLSGIMTKLKTAYIHPRVVGGRIEELEPLIGPWTT